MTAPFRIAKLSFNGGTVVDTSDADVVVLVGPNNAGKSRTLQELWSLAASPPGRPVDPGQLFVLGSYESQRTMGADEITDWLRSNRLDHVEPSTQRRGVRAIGSGDFYLDEVPRFWQQGEHLGSLANQLIRHIGPGDGRNLLGSPGRLEPRQVPDHAIQNLVRNDGARAAFESAFRGAFRQNLIVDSWFSNTKLRLSRSEVQADFAHTSTDGLPSSELADRLDALPLIETQSDGVRAFAGLLLSLITVRYPVLLLDEPETFLHPPQARLLGEYLGRLRGDGQLLVATHSLDILLGLLRHSESRVKIVRLSRRDGRTSALTVEPSDVRSLWNDPLLRFSRVLDGLFHEGVVVCEGDTDSQFYSAIAYHLAGLESSNAATGADGAPVLQDEPPIFGANPFDVMFTYAGGKQRIKMVSAALTAVHVPVRCIVDFDVLNDRGVLQGLVESLRFDYSSEIERLRQLVDAGIRGNERTLTVGGAREAILAALPDEDATAVDRQLRRAIEAAVEAPTGWSAAKKKGIAEVPAGDSSAAVVELLLLLKECGIWVVPSGAVESWVKSVGNKGPTWVVDVIERGLIAEAAPAQEFIAEVLKSLTSA